MIHQLGAQDKTIDLSPGDLFVYAQEVGIVHSVLVHLVFTQLLTCNCSKLTLPVTQSMLIVLKLKTHDVTVPDYIFFARPDVCH